MVKGPIIETPKPKRRTGRKPAVFDARVPRIGSVISKLTPPPDNIVFYARVAVWGMLLNDTYGDCVCAAKLHAGMQFSAYADMPLIATDAEAKLLYEQDGGYVDGDAATDQGCVVMGKGGAMENWHLNGMMIGGKLDKCVAYLQYQRNLHNEVAWRQGIWTFGGLLVGIRMPTYIMAAEIVPYVWDYDPNKDSDEDDGGHEIWINGALLVGGERFYDFISWGARYRMTQRFLEKFIEEAVVVYDPLALNPQGVDARGFHATELAEMMTEISAEV